MKRILILSAILIGLLSSCHRDYDIYPHAGFTVNYDLVKPGEVVVFNSTSHDAKYHTWDFGDGSVSYAVNPTYSYANEGSYVVRLTVESVDGHIDVAEMVIDVAYTELIITVAEWNSSEVIRTVIDGALVILYERAIDWEVDKNAIAWGYTNSNGDISFIDMEERGYWVWSEAELTNGGGYDNSAFYDDGDYDYVLTPIMVPFANNYWTSWVDYYFPFKKNKESRRDKYPDEKLKIETKPRSLK